MPLHLRPLLCWLALTAFASAADYHIDSAAGDDARDGSSPALAWRSLDRVNQTTFQAGDRILFKAGSRFSGQLAPKGSGSENAPIRLGRYGDGPLPRIDGEGRVLDTVLLKNVEFWEVRDLEVTNQGSEPVPWRTGVRIVAENFGAMRHIVLGGLYVHHVNGDLRKSHEGCAIYFETRGRRTPSHFDCLLIENCRVEKSDRNGICQKNGSGPHSRRVIIRRNVLDDIGGDGIKVWGSDAPLIEHNVVRNGRMRCTDAAAGIWPFDCNDARIQFNEVSGFRGTKDGQGFDSDYLCRRTVIQYNYSHDNEGGFILICGPGNSFNEDTIIRYNISRNDGIGSARVFHFGGKSTNTLIYNNTIHISREQDLPMVLVTDWDRGFPDGVKFFNNLFLVDGKVRYDWGRAKNVSFSHNLFHGAHDPLPEDPAAITTRPALKNPTAADGFPSLAGYTPATQDFPRGQVIPQNGGRDFFGKPVPADRPPSIGAVESE